RAGAAGAACPRNLSTRSRWRLCPARAGAPRPAGNSRGVVPAILVENGLVPGGITMTRTSLTFGLGLLAALAAGWFAFPRALYLRREQPPGFAHQTHAKVSGVTQ